MYDPGRSSKNWKVVTYLSNPWRIALARTSEHYEPALLQQVLSQNHVNASIFEILIIASFLAIGTLSDYAFFEVPAAASALLFFTMIIMISSAVFSWVKGWTLTFIIGTFVALNFAFENIPFFRLETQAYGLNYTTKPADYKAYFTQNNAEVTAQADEDLADLIVILEKWKAKAKAAGRVGADGKPKLMVLNVSGGGSRSAYWSARVLQQADSLSKGEFWDQTQFISGSSGGMIGTAYMRELKLRQFYGLGNTPSSLDCEAVAMDLLNPILFTMATNDFFVRYRNFTDGDQEYNVDRAYAFERKLHKNTTGLLNKRLGDYTEAEQEAETPLLLLSPSILEDGRRLLIASQPMSFLSKSPTIGGISENVEFLSLFKYQNPLNLEFSSALRMNATFPYILPTTALPTDPIIEVNDAGIRDNFGLKITLDYLLALREWINENTSGVVIVQIRDTPLNKETKFSQSSLAEKLTRPFGAFTQNFTRIQDYNNEQLFRYADSSFEIPIERINFELTTSSKDEIISLSWHLTRKEKIEIAQALGTKENQESFKQLIGAFE